MFDHVPQLTDAQVQAGAKPGETWAQARQRLELVIAAGSPPPVEDHPGADYSLAGPVNECEGLDGQPIHWAPGELDSETGERELDEATDQFYAWSALTVAQVAALALPGEGWKTARSRAWRLHHCVIECLPCPVCNPTGVRKWGGWIDQPDLGCGACDLESRQRPPRRF
ncbi:hypothetical protein D3C77_392570 [compost metagenome]